jgi:tight adherence protein C
MPPSNYLLFALIFILVVGAFVVLAIVTGRRRSHVDRLGGFGAQHAESAARVVLREGKERQLQQVLAERVLTPLSRLASVTGTEGKLVEKLVYAGIRKKGASEVFLGVKMALALALPAAIASFILWRTRAAGKALDAGTLLMYCPIGLALGLLLPNIWLSRKVKQRQEKIKFGLPNALDLLVICIESGLALDAALLRIGRELRESVPELSEELALLNLEMSAGKPREECLRNLGLRTGVEEVKSLTARIIQSSKFGTNLAHSLRIHAESLREKRRQEAEERAAKTSVKLLFPLVFFIFPALFVVILGPAAVRVRETFLGGG